MKKYIPVHQEKNIISIGYANNKEKYIELKYTGENYQLLENVVKNGLTISELENSLYSQLYKMDFLEELTHYKDINNINRDQLYFQYLNNNNFNESIFSTKILIFGAGALGSTIVYMLAQSGLKNLIVIDDDFVSQTDILKSMVLKKDDIGISKVKAVAKHIKENFDIHIDYLENSFIEYDDLEMIINKYKPDLIIKGCDPDLIFRTHLNKLCFLHDIPFITVAYSFEQIRLGPFYIPGYTDCDEAVNIQQKQAFGEHYDFRENKKLFREYLVHPAVSFNVNILASFLLKEVLMYLTGLYEYCFTIGRYVILDPLSLAIHSWEPKCPDNCEICKPLKK